MRAMSASIRAKDVRLIRRAEQRSEPLRIGDHVRLNSGGPLSTVVDVDGVGRVVAAWRDRNGRANEVALPDACFRLAH